MTARKRYISGTKILLFIEVLVHDSLSERWAVGNRGLAVTRTTPRKDMVLFYLHREVHANWLMKVRTKEGIELPRSGLCAYQMDCSMCSSMRILYPSQEHFTVDHTYVGLKLFLQVIDRNFVHKIWTIDLSRH